MFINFICKLFNLVPQQEASERALELRRKLGQCRGALYSIQMKDPDFTDQELNSILEETTDLQLRYHWERIS